MFGPSCGHWMVFGSVDVCNFFVDVLYTHDLLRVLYYTGKPLKYNDNALL